MNDDVTDAFYTILARTRDEEIDCDRYAAELAAWVDGGIADARLRALLAQHEEVCPECAEERQLLLRALGRES